MLERFYYKNNTYIVIKIHQSDVSAYIFFVSERIVAYFCSEFAPKINFLQCANPSQKTGLNCPSVHTLASERTGAYFCYFCQEIPPPVAFFETASVPKSTLPDGRWSSTVKTQFCSQNVIKRDRGI